ncbi:hypothetical protein R3P38DRAFT_2776502 [Favolaschia claudopus]|uniref:Uncharacterized protein n=1 Tax=Favolaschia claudopus TaxID=2862362 RepID=A0AAW0BLS4_9AGAR
MAVDSGDPRTLTWYGLGGDCKASVASGADEYLDDTTHLEQNTTYDDVGRYTCLDPGWQPDWFRDEKSYADWTPISAATGCDIDYEMGVDLQMHEGQWQYTEDALEEMAGDLTRMWQVVNAIKGHGKYEVDSACPVEFNLDVLYNGYDTSKEAQGIPIDLIRNVQLWKLEGHKKRGFLVSLHRDWQSLNFGLLVASDVPIYYIWGLFDSTNARFGRLNPRLIDAYNYACQRLGVASRTIEDMQEMKEQYQACLKFDEYLDKVYNPLDKKVVPMPLFTTVSGFIRYWMKDAEGWRRRLLTTKEDFWHMDRLFHHAVAKDKEAKVTNVIFHRFHCKPPNLELGPNNTFMDEDIPEQNVAEIRKRFKGHCAPRMGQFFDIVTGVERTAPIDIKDPVAVQTHERNEFLLPPPVSIQGRSLISRVTGEPNPYPDLSRIGRTMGPRRGGPNSDHSSERQEGDSHRPIAFRGGWAAAMARTDNAGNYPAHRRNRRQRLPSRDDSSSEYKDSRSHVSISSRERSPPARRRHYGSSLNYPGRIPRPSQRVVRANHAQRRALDGASSLHLEHGLPERRLLDSLRSRRDEIENDCIADSGRPLPLTRFGNCSGCENYFPRIPIMHRATTKAQLEDNSRRLEAAPSPAQTYAPWLKLLGDIAGLENARAIIARGGVASWIVRAYRYIGLVSKLMEGPSVHVTVFNGGGNDSADEDSLRLKWDELSENDYQCIYGYVPGTTREKDSWMYPPDELLEELSKHYYREWNPTVDDLMCRVRKEGDDKPCRGKLRTRKGWQEFFHGTNHGKWAPKVEVNDKWIEEAKKRFGRAFCGSWNKKPVWDIMLPETFREDF